LRILAVSHSYPRFDGDVAGAFLERLYAALVERGHAVRVIVPSDGGQGGEEQRVGIAVERVRYAAARRETLAHRGALAQAVLSPGGALAFRAMLRALASAVRRRARDADVIHANWWVPAGLAVRRAGVAGLVPMVLTMHGTDAALLRRSRVARWMAGPVLREAARTTAVSSFLAQTAARAGASAPVILPMPADPDRFPEPGPGGAGVVTVGRLTRQKRTDLLIEAVAVLRGRGRAVAFTIVGDGPERGALEALVARRGLSGQVRFAGAVAPADVPRFVGPADVFAFAARHEGFGLAAAEALIAGVPLVVLADGGGVLDIARAGEGAEIVPGAEPARIAEAIERVLADPEARSAAGRAGRHWREALRPAAVAGRLEQVFEEARRP
jgi:glycosyltransferase involved in cell wall biosynthesis